MMRWRWRDRLTSQYEADAWWLTLLAVAAIFIGVGIAIGAAWMLVAIGMWPFVRAIDWLLGW